MQTRRDLLAAAVGAPILLAFGGAAMGQTPTLAGTMVPLEFRRNVSATVAKKGDLIPLEVHRDVRVNGKRLFRKGAVVTGEVMAVDEPGRYGERGRIRIRLRSVKSVDGERYDLAAYQAADRRPQSEVDTRGFLVFEPSGLIEGALVDGKHVTIEKGARILAMVTGPATAPEPTELSDVNSRERPITKINHRRPIDWRDRNIPGHAP